MDAGATYSVALPDAPQGMAWAFIVVAALMQPLLVAKIWELNRRLGGVHKVWEGAKIVFWRLWSGRSEETDLHLAAGSLLADRRVTIATTVINVWWGVMAVGGLVRLLEAAMRPSVVTSAAVTLADVAWLVVLLFTTVGVAFPQTVVERTLAIWLWCATFIVCGLALSSPFLGADVAFFLWSWPVYILYSMGLGGLFLHFRSLLFTNICIFICRTVSFSSYAPSCGMLDIDTVSVFKRELVLLLYKVVVFYCAELALAHSARKEIEAALGKCQGSAVSSLLGFMCDAVVDLDSNFVFKEHSPKLAGLLMHSPGKSLCGLPFAQFVVPCVERQALDWRTEEEDPLGDFLGVSKDPHPQMVSLRMRDAMGNAVPAALYHLPYHSIDGCLHHLIGLQEASDDHHGTLAPGVHRQRPLPAATLNANVAEALVVGRSLLDGHSGNLNRVRSRSSGSSGSGSGDVELGAIVVRAEKSLPIVVADKGVLSRLGLPEEGGSFLEAFVDDGPNFCKGVLEEAAKLPHRAVQAVTMQCGVWYLGVQREDADVQPDRCKLVAEVRNFDGNVDLIKITITLAPRGGRVVWRNRPGPLLTGGLSSCSAGHTQRMVQL